MALELILLHQGDPESSHPAARRSSYIAKCIFDSLIQEGYHVKSLHIDTQLKWVDTLNTLQNRRTSTLVFNAADLGLHYNSTFESHIVSLLETMNFPYTGSSSRTLVTSIDKYSTKLQLRDADIPTPAVQLLSNLTSDKIKTIEMPLIVKPRKAYGSQGIAPSSIVKTRAELEHTIETLQSEKTDLNELIVEEYIEYSHLPEVTVGFIGNKKTRMILPPLGFSFGRSYENRPKIRDFDSKFTEGSTTYGQCNAVPIQLPRLLQRALVEYTHKIAENLEITDYGRFDFRIKQNDGNLVPHIIDPNANPDLNDDASLFLMTKNTGRTYTQFIAQIVNAARQRYDL